MGAVVAGAALILSVAGCASPFSAEGDQALRRRVSGAIDRELAEVPPGSQLIETTQPPQTIETELASRREELDTIGPLVPFAAGKLTMGTDLAGEQQQEVSVSLQSAIETSVRNNLSIQIARLQPAINEATVVAAEAAFDAVFFTNVTWNSTDQPQAVAIVGGTPIGVAAQINNQFRFDTGKPTAKGDEAQAPVTEFSYYWKSRKRRANVKGLYVFLQRTDDGWKILSVRRPKPGE